MKMCFDVEVFGRDLNRTHIQTSFFFFSINQLQKGLADIYDYHCDVPYEHI